MLFRLAQLALWLALVLVGFLVLLAVVYVVHGSLEEFPTAEDTSKVRIVAGVGAAFLLGIELALVALLRRVRLAARGRAVEGAGPSAA